MRLYISIQAVRKFISERRKFGPFKYALWTRPRPVDRGFYLCAARKCSHGLPP